MHAWLDRSDAAVPSRAYGICELWKAFLSAETRVLFDGPFSLFLLVVVVQFRWLFLVLSPSAYCARFPRQRLGIAVLCL